MPRPCARAFFQSFCAAGGVHAPALRSRAGDWCGLVSRPWFWQLLCADMLPPDVAPEARIADSLSNYTTIRVAILCRPT